MLNHQGTRNIETSRLLLRRFSASDAAAMFKNWAHDPEVTRYMRWQPHANVAETTEVLRSWVQGYSSAERYHWGIVLQEKNILIGSIGAVAPHQADESIEVGYCIGRTFWGNAYTAEALKAIIHYLLFDVGFNRVEAYHSVNNPASGRVMQKAGMAFEGRAMQKYRCSEGFQDSDMYGIVKNSLYRPDAEFHFLDPGVLADNELALVCVEKQQADPIKKYVPAYAFEMRLGGVVAGSVHLRIGFTDALYYGGHIGYEVYEAFRGHSYAARSCRLLAPLLKRHGYKQVLVNNDPENWASRRTCEKIGAKLVRIAEVPRWHELYTQMGRRRECIWEWNLED